MGRTRRIVCCVVASVILEAGAYLLVSHLLHGERFSVRLIGAASFLVIVGAIWLWVDGIAPALGWRSGEDG